ncbi:MAG: hypothetical protein WC924_05355 [Candidatus Gracilibacteria bacterium]
MKIQPIEYALFCDYASMSIDGKLNLVGIFERIMSEQTPAIHSQMFVVSKILIPKGKHSITFSLMQQDKVLAKSTIEKEVEKPLSSHTHFWGVQGLKIETWDPIELQILFEGKQVYIKRLPVVQVQKKAKS